MSLKFTQHEQNNLIHSTHLPLEVGVTVTTELLEEVEEANENVENAILNPVSILNANKIYIM